MSNLRYHHDFCPPEIKTTDITNVPVKLYDWEYNEKKRCVEPVFTGEFRDIDADVKAARQETLTEMMARMPGRSPIEKVEYAVNAGLIVPPVNADGEPAKTIDLRGVPNDIAEAQAMQRKAAEAYDQLPLELKNAEGSTLEEKLANYIKAAQAAAEAAQKTKEEVVKQ